MKTRYSFKGGKRGSVADVPPGRPVSPSAWTTTSWNGSGNVRTRLAAGITRP